MSLYMDDLSRNLVPIDKPIGNFSTKITHNWCDSSTFLLGASDSTWELDPGTGNTWKLVKSELQYKDGIDFTGGKKIIIDYYMWIGGSSIKVETVEIDSEDKIYEYGNDHYHKASTYSTVMFNYPVDMILYGDDPGENYKFHKIVLTLDSHAAVGGSYATIGFITVPING